MPKDKFRIKAFLVLCSALLTLTFIISGCAPTNNKEETNKITIAGSTTILPISEHWASAFNKKTGTIVNVQGGGSTNGINLVKAGSVDIGASSRELSSEEETGLRKIEIGRDALAIIINPNNQVENLSVEQLKKIFSGEIKNWKELGGQDRAIQVINRESGSGTRSTFEELVMCNGSSDKENCSKSILSAIVLNSNSEVKRSVEIIGDSIGYVSLGFVDKKVKAIKLNDIQPSEEAVKDGTYAVSRGLYYLVKNYNNSETIKKYLDFVLSSEAQSALIEEGFLPVK